VTIKSRKQCSTAKDPWCYRTGFRPTGTKSHRNECPLERIPIGTKSQ